MQGLSAKGGQRRLGSGGQQGGFGLKPWSVNRISQNRMADGGEVNADLVRPAGLQGASEQAGNRLSRHAGIALALLPMGDRFPPARRDAMNDLPTN